MIDHYDGNLPPHERRNFVHKRLLGAAKGFVTSGFNPLSAVGGFLAPTAPPVRRPAPRSTVARPSAMSSAEKEMGRSLKFGGGTGLTVLPRSLPRRSLAAPRCTFPLKPDPVTGECKLFLGDRPGRDTDPLQIGPGTGVGDAVMGRFGAALEPGSRIVDRAVCLRGMVLGNDGLCYNSRGFPNGDRMWPRGRKPLLTGGEMRAISVASRAATRLTNAAVRLQDIGLIKKPVARRRSKKKS